MRFLQVFFIIMAASIVIPSNAQSNEGDKETHVKSSDEVQVYYFHMTRRCATCKAVERVSEEAVQKMNSDEVSFAAYNIEETKGEQIAEKLNISGQTLLVTNGDKKINITREGFMNARSKPEELKKIVQQKVKSLQ
ncbi:MAG: nitrophenyl compound nitroreductase subunit ArsF family protein [Bacteroidales bacterium]|nr:nitrophenyl compound nitroreductase subunit ArsF family protein [Bacteroidales bacterium]MCF8338932.1 nitrophenyl compound nitroreductase subunit ArsF family protein [Bacteroidales bacterium]